MLIRYLFGKLLNHNNVPISLLANMISKLDNSKNEYTIRDCGVCNEAELVNKRRLAQVML